MRFLLIILLFAGPLDARSRKKESQKKHQEKEIIGAPTKLIKDMDFDEAAHAKAYYEMMGQDNLVTKALEHMLVTNKKNPYELKKVRLELAKRYEAAGEKEKALKIYQEFLQFYPGTEEYEEAYAQMMKVHFSLTNDYRRDQTKTYECLELAKVFLEEENGYETFRPLVEEILSQCYEKLIDHDIYVCNQYLAQFSYTENEKDLKAARHRLNSTKEKYVPHAETKRADVEALERTIDAYDPAKKPETTTNDAAAQKPDYSKIF